MRLTLSFLLASAAWVSAADIAPGRWEGSAQVPQRELQLVVDLAQDGGSWKGSAIVPGMGLKGVPLTDIAIKGSEATFSFGGPRGLQITCKGTLNAQGALTGDFVVAGNSAPFSLQKTGPAQVEPLPHSTAITKELEGEWKGDYELFGYPRHVTIKLVSHAADAGTAEFVVVGKKTNNLPVDLVTQEGDLITIDSGAAGISFEGRFNKTANTIKGAVIQGPIEAPITLQRAK